ncbi:DNA-binding protein, partial [Vibrio sp. Vb2880]
MWFLSKQLIGLPGLPKTTQGVSLKANRENWLKRKPEGVKGRAFEYSFDSLPA